MTGEPVLRTGEGEGWTFALLGSSLAELGVQARGVLHVGAHHGEEIPHYRRAGFGNIVLVEPDPASCQLIRDRADYPGAPPVMLYQGACGKAPGTATFHRNAKSFFSGLEDRGTGADRTIDMFDVGVRTVAQLTDVPWVGSLCNVLVVDTQGTELDVLAGADLERFELVICEAWDLSGLGRPPKIRCGPSVHELEAYMALRGWFPVMRWVYDRSGYFDQLYRPRG